MDIKTMEKEPAGAGYVCGWYKPIEYAGYIYICVNRLFPGMVKIGYADDLEKRVRGLSGTNVPEAYHCYAAYKVVERLEDKTLHQLIDGFDPNLRYDKGREFYTMSPERAYKILSSIAKVSGTQDRLELNPLKDNYFTPSLLASEKTSSDEDSDFDKKQKQLWLWRRLNYLIEKKGYRKLGRPLESYKAEYFTVDCGIGDEVHLDVLADRKKSLGLRIWFRHEDFYENVKNNHKNEVERVMGCEMTWRAGYPLTSFDVGWMNLSDEEIDRVISERVIPLVERAKAAITPYLKTNFNN